MKIPCEEAMVKLMAYDNKFTSYTMYNHRDFFRNYSLMIKGTDICDITCDNCMTVDNSSHIESPIALFQRGIV